VELDGPPDLVRDGGPGGNPAITVAAAWETVWYALTTLRCAWHISCLMRRMAIACSAHTGAP